MKRSVKRYAAGFLVLAAGIWLGHTTRPGGEPGSAGDLPAGGETRADHDNADRVPGRNGSARARTTSGIDASLAASRLRAIAFLPGRPDFEELAPWLDAWATSDPEGLFDFYQSLRSEAGNRWLADHIEEQLAKTWGAMDPARALLAADRLGDWRHRENFIRNLIQGVATQSPGHAFELLKQRPELEPDARKDLAYHIYETWGIKDPAGAFAHATTHAHPDQRRTILMNLARIFGESRPREAYAWASALTDPLEKHRALIYVLRGMCRVDPGLAETTLKQIAKSAPDDVLIHQIKYQLIEELSLHHPAKALAMLDDIAAGGGRVDAIQRLASSQARLDPLGALDWSLLLADPKERKSALTSALSTWARMDAAAAADYIIQRPELDVDPALKRDIAEQWSGVDPLKALAFYLDNVADAPGDAQETKVAILSNLMLKDSSDALRMLAERPGALDPQKLLSPAIVQWIGRAPDEIPKVLDFARESRLTPELSGAIATGWTSVDPVAAGEWILQMEEGTAKEAALAGMLSQTAATSPDASIEMAFQIQNAELRLGFLQDAIMEIANHDPDYAYRMLDAPRLTRAEKDSIGRTLRIRHPRE